MNSLSSKPSIAAEFPADHDLNLISQDLDEMFFLSMTSECLSDFETPDRVSFVQSYRTLKDLISSLQRQKELSLSD